MEGYKFTHTLSMYIPWEDNRGNPDIATAWPSCVGVSGDYQGLFWVRRFSTGWLAATRYFFAVLQKQLP